MWHSESQTFPKRAHAVTWAQRRETELKTGGPASAVVHGKSVGQVVLAYRDMLARGSRPLNNNQHWTLKRVARSFMAVAADKLTPQHVVDYMLERRDEGAGPVTCMTDFIYMRVALRDAHHILGLKCAWDAPEQAKPLLKKMQLIKRSGKRKRRLEGDEESRLMDYFAVQDQDRRVSIPMAVIVPVAIDTCMRQGEICRIRWDDLNPEKRTVVIRQRKDPQAKEERDDTIPLMGRSWDLIQAQSRANESIFPYRPHSVCDRFTIACSRLGIKNLHFHDLRREGATRLLEQGVRAPQVILLTGHRDWNQFARYIGLRPEDLHQYC
ncbi:MAG: site-specific integrase [Gammaproteobacteria bacterium]